MRSPLVRQSSFLWSRRDSIFPVTAVSKGPSKTNQYWIGLLVTESSWEFSFEAFCNRTEFRRSFGKSPSDQSWVSGLIPPKSCTETRIICYTPYESYTVSLIKGSNRSLAKISHIIRLPLRLSMLCDTALKGWLLKNPSPSGLSFPPEHFSALFFSSQPETTWNRTDKEPCTGSGNKQFYRSPADQEGWLND